MLWILTTYIHCLYLQSCIGDFYVHTSSAKYGELVVGNWFAINQFNGSIQTVSPIDREEQSEFQLTVMVRLL